MSPEKRERLLLVAAARVLLRCSIDNMREAIVNLEASGVKKNDDQLDRIRTAIREAESAWETTGGQLGS